MLGPELFSSALLEDSAYSSKDDTFSEDNSCYEISGCIVAVVGAMAMVVVAFVALPSLAVILLLSFIVGIMAGYLNDPATTIGVPPDLI